MAVMATAGDDVQAKLAPAAGGGQFISYFSGSGYDVMLDRLDESGASMWAAPVVVSDRSLSSTVDYGLASDGAGRAFVCFNTTDAQGASVQLMSAVDGTGAILWTSTVYTGAGVALGNGRATVASDGFVWGATAANSTTAVQRFNPATGAASFTTPISITETGANQLASGLQPSLDGSVILATVRYTTFTSAKVLRAHRINTDGSRPWLAVGNSVFTTGSVQIGNFPDFITDGSGGAYFSWYSVSPLTCRVQHMGADGVMTWGTNGAPVGTSTTASFGGTTATLNRTNPATMRGSDGRVYSFFRGYSSSIAGVVWYGIAAQCFNADGTTAWGTDGVMVEPYAPAAAGIVYDRATGAALDFGGSPGISYTNSSSAINATAVAARMNADGTVAWSSTIASDPSTKYRFVSSSAPEGAAIVAWQGGPSTSPSDLFCARVAADGSLGPPPASTPGDVNGDGLVDAADLGQLLSEWGTAGTADFNDDGVVDAVDLGVLLSAWTP